MFKALRYNKRNMASIQLSKWYLGLFLNLPLHKGLECEFKSDSDIWNWFFFKVLSSKKGDHASLINLEVSLLWFRFKFNIYDSRHWNYEKDRFYLPGEEKMERMGA